MVLNSMCQNLSGVAFWFGESKVLQATSLRLLQRLISFKLHLLVRNLMCQNVPDVTFSYGLFGLIRWIIGTCCSGMVFLNKMCQNLPRGNFWFGIIEALQATSVRLLQCLGSFKQEGWFELDKPERARCHVLLKLFWFDPLDLCHLSLLVRTNDLDRTRRRIVVLFVTSSSFNISRGGLLENIK